MHNVEIRYQIMNLIRFFLHFYVQHFVDQSFIKIFFIV